MKVMNKEEVYFDIEELNKELMQELTGEKPDPVKEEAKRKAREEAERKAEEERRAAKEEAERKAEEERRAAKEEAEKKIQQPAAKPRKSARPSTLKIVQDSSLTGKETPVAVKKVSEKKPNAVKKKNKKKKIKLTIFLTILCIVAILFGTVLGAYMILKNRGETALKENKAEQEISAPVDVEVEEKGKFVVYKGKKYCYNENNINILCMGVDKSIQETGKDNIGENGQADALILAVLDSETGHLSLVNISRDAMVDVNKYNVKGQYLGTENMQLCLAYSYGDGKEQSCANTMESVSRLLYGMPINAYAAMEYSAISILNDAVGGVTVEVLEDLTQSDAALQKGSIVTLKGEQAHTYVRSRNTEVLDSNNMRMNRQKQYLDAFVQKAISETKSNITTPVNLYNSISDYMVTNINSSEITYLASLIMENGITGGDMFTVPGEVKQGKKYAEFIPDDEKLYELILDVFYKQADKQ